MEEEKKGFFTRLKEGLSRTRANIVDGLNGVFSHSEKIDDDFYDELEEVMVMGDIGIDATEEILDRLKAQVKEQHIKAPAECRELLIGDIRDQMRVDEHAYDFENETSVVLVIGVNGVGKTTTIGKLASIYKQRGKKVLIAAADTFRAAAYDQLKIWAERAGVDMISGNEGADPASVVYDAVNAAKARHADILLIDTAGRLQNKKNLMAELGKIDRIITREDPGVKRENLIVLDGTTGQNALSQAKEFSAVTNLTGIILTKMDGTAKGGIAIAVQAELGIPVKYIGVGEQLEDLQRFHPDAFVDALFGIDENASRDEENIASFDAGSAAGIGAEHPAAGDSEGAAGSASGTDSSVESGNGSGSDNAQNDSAAADQNADSQNPPEPELSDAEKERQRQKKAADILEQLANEAEANRNTFHWD